MRLSLSAVPSSRSRVTASGMDAAEVLPAEVLFAVTMSRATMTESVVRPGFDLRQIPRHDLEQLTSVTGATTKLRTGQMIVSTPGLTWGGCLSSGSRIGQAEAFP